MALPDCVEICTRSATTTGPAGERDTCLDCDDEAACAVNAQETAPRDDVETDETVDHVRCEAYFENRSR